MADVQKHGAQIELNPSVAKQVDFALDATFQTADGKLKWNTLPFRHPVVFRFRDNQRQAQGRTTTQLRVFRRGDIKRFEAPAQDGRLVLTVLGPGNIRLEKKTVDGKTVEQANGIAALNGLTTIVEKQVGGN
jgi:hypothetical protein